jgi:hypothetical protein
MRSRFIVPLLVLCGVSGLGARTLVASSTSRQGAPTEHTGCRRASLAKEHGSNGKPAYPLRDGRVRTVSWLRERWIAETPRATTNIPAKFGTRPPAPAKMPCGDEHSCCLRPGTSQAADIPSGAGKHRPPMRLIAVASDGRVARQLSGLPYDSGSKFRFCSSFSMVLRI